jgi:hypothetical protein
MMPLKGASSPAPAGNGRWNWLVILAAIGVILLLLSSLALHAGL